MGARKLNRKQREHHLAEVARLYLRGTRQYLIAEELRVEPGQICYDLKLVQKRWRVSALSDFNDAKSLELAKGDEMEREYWNSWTNSKTRNEEHCGDPRYLQGVQWCIHKRCEILGLNAPTRIAPTDPSGTKPYSSLSDAELERIIAGPK